DACDDCGRGSPDRRHKALGPTLLGVPGHGPSKRWNRRAGPRNRKHSLWPVGRWPVGRRESRKPDRFSDAPLLAEQCLRMRGHLYRRTLASIPTVRSLVPTKVGEVGASQEREVGAAAVARQRLGATFDLASMMDNPALARQCHRRTGRGGLGPRPAVPRAVALITTAGFWATCAALAQPSRAAVSYAQAEDACTEGTAGRGSKALRRLLSNLWVCGQTTDS